MCIRDRSNLTSNQFYFGGFISSNKVGKEKKILLSKYYQMTGIWFDTCNRLLHTLKTMFKIYGNRNVSIMRELTKTYEEIILSDLEKIQNIISKTSQIKNILFISSTSVYGSMQGKINSQTIAHPNNKNGIEILKTENLIKSENNTIIRFGGLINKDRNPLKHLIQKDEVLNPEAPINYIHLKDCIGIISKVIKQNNWGKIYSAVAPFHPTKKEYYDNLCKINNIKKLKFSNKKTVINKEVNDNTILSELKYDFKYPTL